MTAVLLRLRERILLLKRDKMNSGRPKFHSLNCWRTFLQPHNFVLEINKSPYPARPSPDIIKNEVINSGPKKPYENSDEAAEADEFAFRELSVMDTHFYVEYEISPMQTFCRDLHYCMLSLYKRTKYTAAGRVQA